MSYFSFDTPLLVKCNFIPSYERMKIASIHNNIVMIRKTIQQVAYQLRNQPLLSVITILGTALAIALIMVILIVYQAKTADYAPEVNRSRSLYVKWERTVYNKKNPNSAGHSRPSLWVAKEVFYPLKTAEAVCVTYDAGEVLVSTPGSEEEVNTPFLLTDDDFWKIYRFNFLSGKPFTQADFQSGLKKAVIVESVARRLYGDVDVAIGKPILINFTDYTVCGVVKDVNRFCEFAWSEVYAPYSSNAIANETNAGETSDNHIITILAHRKADFEEIRNEVARGVAQLNTTLGEKEMQLMGQPDNFRTQLNRKFANEYENLDAAYWKYGIMIAIILLVPAINLSGLTHTRMRRRLEELGIRKSFGATQGELVWQVLNENFILTLIGGILGLGLSYLCLWLMGGWLLQTAWGATATMNVSMVSPVVFFVAFGFCLILNLLSAYIPARRVAHTPIVDSLNQKL